MTRIKRGERTIRNDHHGAATVDNIRRMGWLCLTMRAIHGAGAVEPRLLISPGDVETVGTDGVLAEGPFPWRSSLLFGTMESVSMQLRRVGESRGSKGRNAPHPQSEH